MASITSSSGISSILGQYSGITSDDIEKLLAADSTRKLRAQNEISSIKAQKTAWGDIRTRLNNFFNKIEALQKTETFQTKKVKSSNESIASVEGTSEAVEGTYELKVKQLATATKVIGARVSDSSKSELDAEGTLTLTSADKDKDGNPITIDIEIESTDSLSDIAQKINKQSKETNISANIIDNRLVLTDKKMGERTFTVSGNAAEAIGVGSTAQTTIGKPAIFELDGLEMTRDTNKISDVIDGVTFTLSKQSDETVKLSLENDTAKLTTAVKEMVDQYNSLMSFIGDNLSVGDPSSENNTTGKLVGDSALTRLQSELRNLITTPFVAGSALKPESIGISSVDREGTLGFDEERFKEALEKDPELVKSFFYQSQKVTEEDGSSKTEETGYTAGLKDLINKYIVNTSSNKGIIASKAETFDAAVKDLNKQIDRFDSILEMKKARYVTMFTKLDQAMMAAEEQMNYLISQVSSFSN